MNLKHLFLSYTWFLFFCKLIKADPPPPQEGGAQVAIPVAAPVTTPISTPVSTPIISQGNSVPSSTRPSTDMPSSSKPSTNMPSSLHPSTLMPTSSKPSNLRPSSTMPSSHYPCNYFFQTIHLFFYSFIISVDNQLFILRKINLCCYNRYTYLCSNNNAFILKTYGPEAYEHAVEFKTIFKTKFSKTIEGSKFILSLCLSYETCANLHPNHSVSSKKASAFNLSHFK